MATVLVSFGAGAIVAAGLAITFGHSPKLVDLGLGAASGLAAGVALWAIYQAFVLTSVGVAAPIAAVVSGVIPVVLDSVTGAPPSDMATIGIVIGLVSLILAAWSPGTADLNRGIALAAFAGLAFAAMLLLGAETSAESGLWPLVAQRSVAAMLIAVSGAALGRELLPREASVKRTAAIGGVFGTLGVGAIFIGFQRATTATVGAVAVAGSMYPAVTVALRWMFDGERLRWWQAVGLAGSLVGVALIAGG